jgi:hypothetical protein
MEESKRKSVSTKKAASSVANLEKARIARAAKAAAKKEAAATEAKEINEIRLKLAEEKKRMQQ